jgi:hypothetical protein
VIQSRSNGSVDGAAERGKGGESRGSGSGDATRRRARGAWLRPAGGVPTTSQLTAARPRLARAAHLCFGSGAPTRLTHGPRLSAGEGVRRERRGARGPAREGKGWAEP